MAFPGTSLDLLVEMYFGRWVDLSDRLTSVPVTIPQRGAPTGSRSAAAGSCSVTLDDDDGALTPLNPYGTYYPHVRRGAPARVSVRRLNDDFDRTVSAGWGTDWVSVAAGGTVSPSDSSVSSGHGVHSVPAALAYRANYYDAVSLSDAEVRCVFELPDTTITGGAVEPANVMLRLEDLSTYYLVRVSVDTSEVVTVALHHTVSGELAAAVSTGITYSGQQIAVAGICVGPWFAAKVWDAASDEPRDWQVEVVDHTYTGRGYCGIRSGVGNGNSDTKPIIFRYNSVEIRSPRAYGTAAAYRPAIVPRTDRTMVAAQKIEIGGLLRRLERGRSGARSAATRYLAATDPVFYHPLEDGADSTQAASGIRGGSAMTVRNGVMDFTDDAPPGASGSAHPNPNASNALVGLVAAAGTTGFQMGVWTKAEVIDDDVSNPAATGYYIPWELRTSGGHIFRLIMQWDEDTAIAFAHYTSETQLTPVNFLELADNVNPHTNPGITGEWIHVQVMVRQSGVDVDAFLWIDGEFVDSATWTSVTVGAPIRVNAIGGFAGLPGEVSKNIRDIWLSELVLHDFVNFQVVQYPAGLGFPGELSVDRAERVAGEEGEPIHITPGPNPSTAMGPQPTGTLLDVLRDCETASFDVLGESRGVSALTYVARSARYNLPVSMEVDLSTYGTTKGTSGSVLSPVYDDQGLRNEVEVTREGGTSVTVVDQASIDADERYDDSTTVNVAYDYQLPHIAGWLLAEGVVDEYRNPALAVDLGANPDLIDAWLSTDVAHRVQRTNPPAPHPPGVIDQIITGYSESLSLRSWTATANATPAAPWTVGVVQDSVLGRADTDGSKWNADFDAGTDTSALVVVTAGPPWITTANQSSMFPFNIKSGGSVLTVTGIAAAVSDSFTRTVGAGGWGTATTGQSWSVTAGTAANCSVTSNQGRTALTATNDIHLLSLDVGTIDADPITEVVVPVVPTGAPFTIRSVARLTDAANYYYAELTIGLLGVVTLRLHKRVANTATQLGSTVQLGPTHGAGDRWVLQCSAIGSTIRARAWKSGQPVERGWHITATDTALTSGTRAGVAARRETSNTNGSQNVDFDNFAAPGLQTFTITATPVNGVERTIPAGTALSLVDPWRLAL